jgi:hypothetical protein
MDATEFDRDAFTVAEREWTPRPLVPERIEVEMNDRAAMWFEAQLGEVVS